MSQIRDTFKFVKKTNGTSNDEDSMNSDDSQREPSSSIQDIHPIELTAQSIIGPSLEKLGNSVTTLHESQIVLLTRITLMEERLKLFNDSNKSDVSIELNNCLQKINQLKKKLIHINSTLENVNERADTLYSSIF